MVALSGGVDSTALLAALAARRPAGLQLRAVHVNHGIHPDSREWSAHCRAFAATLRVPIEVLTTKVSHAGGVSLEAAARDARYGLLAGLLEKGEFLLTAHHEDDQLETVLLQLFRGTGLAGLAAMPRIAPFAGGWLARPLLTVPRRELEEWVRAEHLEWVEDATNADDALDRNYLRRRVLPLIRERWKGVGTAVTRSARHAAEGQRLLDAVARVDVERASDGPELSVKALRALQPDRRRNALRYWIDRAGVRVPDTKRLEELAGPVIDARPDSNPAVAWAGVVVQRHADLLSIRKVGSGAGVGAAGVTAAAGAADGDRAPIVWAWRHQSVLDLPGHFGTGAGGSLELKADPHGPIDLDALPEALTVRWREGGERLRPRRGGPRRPLKSLLQEVHLPIAERAALPLVFFGAMLLAVGALWLDASVQAAPSAKRRGRLIWRGSIK